MNPTLLASFAQGAAEQRRALFGVPVRYNGETVTLCVTIHPPSLDLETGGFQTTRRITVRMPDHLPKPSIGTPLTLVNDNQTYYTVTEAGLTGAAHAAEYLVEAESR